MFARLMGTHEAHRLDYLRYARHSLDVVRDPSPAGIEAIFQQYVAFDETNYIALHFAGSRYDIDFKIRSNGITTANLAKTTIAAERFRRDHGRLPTSLSDLVPHYLPVEPQDTWDESGHPIRLHHSDGQLAIYSVGPNGIDDGGVPFKIVDVEWPDFFPLRPPGAKDTAREDLDIVFMLYE